MRKWPDVLPTPSAPGFGLSPVDQSIRTDLETGSPRVRRITRARNDLIETQFVMTDVEFVAFRAWWSDDAWSLAGDSDSLSAWTLSGVTRTAGAAISPDLALVDVLTETTATTGHYGQLALADVVAGGTVVVRATVKTSGRDWVRLSYIGWDGVQRYADYDTASEAWGTSSGVVSYEAEARGDGWHRLTITALAGTGGSTPAMRVQTLSSGASSYTGDGASTMAVCEIGARMQTGYDLHLRTDASGNALGAAGGSAWVEMPLATGGGMTTAECRFRGPYKAQAAAGLIWTVTAQMEARNA